MSTKLLYSFIFFLINFIGIVHSFERCRQQFGNNRYDLNQLSSITLTGDDGSFRYSLTPCNEVPNGKCGKTVKPLEKGMTACQERILTSNFESAMGFLDGYGKSPNLEFNENPQGPGTGIVMTMRNALCNGRQRLVKVTFVCDENIKNPTKMDVVETPICEFKITVRASQACPVKSTGGGGGGGITGGGVFIISLFVVIVVYVLGGILYNRVRHHERGIAVLPHPSFWLLMFVSFVEGCRVTLNVFRSYIGNTTSTSASKYESV